MSSGFVIPKNSPHGTALRFLDAIWGGADKSAQEAFAVDMVGVTPRR